MIRLLSNSLNPWLAIGLLAAAATTWIPACGGNTAKPKTGGESHFLYQCDGDCGSGFECIGEVCTQSCIVGGSTCASLDSDAICTNQSVEPGAVAICDVSCERTADCRSLSARHVCSDGFCRGPHHDSSSPADSGAGDSPAGGGTTSQGGAGQGGAATTSGGSPGNAGSASQGGSGNGSGGAGGTSDAGSSSTVGVCPDIVDTDPVDVKRYIIEGDVLTLEVGYGGGCAEHSFALCYEDGFDTSRPPSTALRVLHDSGGDTCEAYLAETLTFDLTPLAEKYKETTQAEGGVVGTNYGAYAFGILSCDWRTLGGSLQASTAAEQADRSCATVDDCEWTSIDTKCSAACGALVSKTGAAEIADWLASTNKAVCGDFENDGCDPVPIPPCVPPAEPACSDGECVPNTQ